MEAPFADRVREPGDQRDRAEIEERRRRGRQPFQRQRRLLQVLRRELHQVPYRRPGNHHVEIAQGALRDAGARSQRSRVAAGRRDELREAAEHRRPHIGGAGRGAESRHHRELSISHNFCDPQV
jgi:hypothetical protein